MTHLGSEGESMGRSLEAGHGSWQPSCGLTGGGVEMAGLDVRSFESPDEDLQGLEKVQAQRIHVGGRSVWKFTFEPGWRYTEHFQPQLCTTQHAGYVASGRLHIQMEDGTQAVAEPDQVAIIGPGHDAWTIGDAPCVFIDFGESFGEGR
jgi:hypothetical protein